MAGHAVPLVKKVHDLRTQPDVELRLDQRIGHGVVGAFDFHVVSNVDPGMFPFSLCIGVRWQGPEGGTVERLKQPLTRAREFFARTGMQGWHEGLEGRIDLSEGEEGVVPEPSENPALHDLHPGLPLGLIPGLGSARWEDGKAIMLREGSLGAIDLRFIAMGAAHGRFEMVRDDDLGDPTESRKGLDRRADPVGQPLRPGRLGIGIVRGTKDRHANRHVMHFPTMPVDHRDALPGVIDKELLPSTMMLAHDQIKFLRPGSVGVTTPAVLPALGRGCLLFLPQQDQRDALAFEFAVDCGPIRHPVRRRGSGRDARKQQPFQRALIIGGGHRPR